MTSLHRSLFTGASVTILVSILVVGCGSSDSPTPVTGSPSASDDERGNVGVPPPAVEYCQKLGFTIDAAGQCVFPDGTSCEEWAFYRGTCGQAHSYCNQHGGSVSSKTQDMGGYTAVFAVCNRDGKQCDEETFQKTGTCN